MYKQKPTVDYQIGYDVAELKWYVAKRVFKWSLFLGKHISVQEKKLRNHIPTLIQDTCKGEKV